VNKQVARVETIKTFRLIEQILTAEDEELTPTMKLRRAFVNEKYRELIDGMYAESPNATRRDPTQRSEA
jgi:long-chain acyl-CoA synthetase